MKKKFLRKSDLKNALFVFLIAFSAFLAFEPLFNSLQQSAAQEFASAIFGTIFAAVITMVLLSRQTETEEEKSRSEKVFEEKLTLYNQAIDVLQDIFKQANAKNQVEMAHADIVELEFILAKLIMVADEKTIHEFRLIYQNISKHYSPKTGLLNLTSTDRHIVFRFSDYCREDLGLSSQNIQKEILEDIVYDGELFYHLEEEAHLSPNILNTLKDIYGYFVFDLSTPLQRIVFQPDGFEIYKSEVHKELMVRCKVIKESLYVTLPGNNYKMKHFTPDDTHTIQIVPQSRNKFIEDFEGVKAMLKRSKDN